VRRARSEERVDVLLNSLEQGLVNCRGGSRRDDLRTILIRGFRAPNDGVDGWGRLERLFSAARLQKERLGVFAGVVVWERGAEDACSDAHLALRGW
jgi:hypothetical protein